MRNEPGFLMCRVFAIIFFTSSNAMTLVFSKHYLLTAIKFKYNNDSIMIIYFNM